MTKKKECQSIIDRIKIVTGSSLDSKPIYLHEPNFDNSNAKKYLSSCIDSGWVSSSGNWVTEFERKIKQFTGAKYAIAVSNGTVALRLSLSCLGVSANDEVLIPPMSFVATANSVSHLGAFPHFIDIEKDTLGMCPDALDRRLREIAIIKNGILYNKETERKISAVIVVHVFGLISKIEKLKLVCKKWKIPLIEDAAEALGSYILKRGKYTHAGSIGDIGTISFNGNKIITSGGGGILITNQKKLADLARHLSTTAKLKHQYEFFHDQVGWNDRLPNINAALGTSQMEMLDDKLKNKRKLHSEYNKYFEDLDQCEIIKEKGSSRSNYWLITLRLNMDNHKLIRDQLLNDAYNSGIFIRPVWKLLSELPMYKNCQKSLLVEAKNQSKRLINLPSSPQLLEKKNIKL